MPAACPAVPAPRFLGWREWTPTGNEASEEEGTTWDKTLCRVQALWSNDLPFNSSDEFELGRWKEKPQRRALWSDDNVLNNSDGFDIARWRAECDAELAAAGKRQRLRRPSREKNPRPPKGFSPGLPLLAGEVEVTTSNFGDYLSLCRSTGGSFLPRRTSHSGMRWTSRSSTTKSSRMCTDTPHVLPPLTGEPQVITSPTAMVSAAELAEMAETSLSQHDPVAITFWRSDVHSALIERERHQEKQAQQRRNVLEETGQEHRRRAAMWKTRHTARSACLSSMHKTSVLLPSSEVEQKTETPQDVMSTSSRLRKMFDKISSASVQRSPSLDVPTKSSTPPTAEAQEESQNQKERVTIDTGNTYSPPRAAKSKLRSVVIVQCQRRRKHKQKLLRMSNSRQARFADLPDDEKEALRQAFVLYSGPASAVYAPCVLKCLWELGLRGNTGYERSIVEKSLHEVLHGLCAERSIQNKRGSPRSSSNSPCKSSKSPLEHKGPMPEQGPPLKMIHDMNDQIGFEEFAVEVVPVIRASLVDARSDAHFAEFMRVMESTQGTSITRGQYTELVRRLNLDIDDATNAIDLCLNTRDAAESRAQATASLSSIDASENETVQAKTETEHPQAQKPSAPKDRPANFTNASASPKVGATPGRRGKAAPPRKPNVNPGAIAAEKGKEEDKAAAAAAAAAAATQKAQGENADKSAPLRALHDVIAKKLIDTEALPEDKEEEQEEETLEFDTVHEVLYQLEEKTDRHRRRHEHQIKRNTGMDDQMFQDVRPELIDLDTVFRLFDVDDSGYLSHREVRQLLKHLGIQVKRDSSMISRVLQEVDWDGNGEVDFKEFLGLIHRVRAHEMLGRRSNLQNNFDKYDKDGNKSVPVPMIEVILSGAGLVHDKTTQEIARTLVGMMETERAGEISFQELEELGQRIVERNFMNVNQRNLALAKSLGFDITKLAEYQFAFDQFDVDGDGALSLAEIREALNTFMIRTPTLEELSDVYRAVDMDADGSVSFQEFLQLMKVVAAGIGLFSTEAPFQLASVPNEKLREVLKIFHMPVSYVRELSPAELVDIVADCMEVTPDMNMREAEPPIRSVRALLDVAKKRARYLEEATKIRERREKELEEVAPPKRRPEPSLIAIMNTRWN